jgi:D-alanine-D-alanine ligase
MRIREVVPEDENKLLGILEATGVFRKDEIEIAQEVIRESLEPATTYQTFCITGEGERVLGYACWGATPCTVGTFDLYWIAVDPDFQGTGLGKKLMHFVEERVRRQGGRMLLIETSSLPQYEATRNFYLGMGYKQLAVIPDFYREGDDKVIYGKSFLSQADCDTVQ